jgi:hypothetical protein
MTRIRFDGLAFASQLPVRGDRRAKHPVERCREYQIETAGQRAGAGAVNLVHQHGD